MFASVINNKLLVIVVACVILDFESGRYFNVIIKSLKGDILFHVLFTRSIRHLVLRFQYKNQFDVTKML